MGDTDAQAVTTEADSERIGLAGAPDNDAAHGRWAHPLAGATALQMSEDANALPRRRSGDWVRPAGRHRPPRGERGHGFGRQPGFGAFAHWVGFGAADTDGAPLAWERLDGGQRGER